VPPHTPLESSPIHLSTSPARPEELVSHPGVELQGHVLQQTLHPAQVGWHFRQPYHQPAGRNHISSQGAPGSTVQAPSPQPGTELGSLHSGHQAHGNGSGVKSAPCWWPLL
jgi:hypothetical protein